MLDTREAAMMEANDFQDSSGVLLSSEKCDIPLTITHSMLTSWAAANSPLNRTLQQQKQIRTSYIYWTWIGKIMPLVC